MGAKAPSPALTAPDGAVSVCGEVCPAVSRPGLLTKPFATRYRGRSRMTAHPDAVPAPSGAAGPDKNERLNPNETHFQQPQDL
jgi:hypothetical protein